MVFSVSLFHPQIFIVYFFEMWLSFFFLFLGHASWHAFFFFGATIVYHIFYFRDVTEREFVIIWSIYLVDGGNANSLCRNFASGCGRVHDLDQERMRRFSLGSQNLTKLNEVTSSICIRFSWSMTHGSGRNLSSLRNLPSFRFLKTKL